MEKKEDSSAWTLPLPSSSSLLQQMSLENASTKLKQSCFAQLSSGVLPSPHTFFTSHSANLLKLMTIQKIILVCLVFLANNLPIQTKKKCLIDLAYQQLKKLNAQSSKTAFVCNKKVQGKISWCSSYHAEPRNSGSEKSHKPDS